MLRGYIAALMTQCSSAHLYRGCLSVAKAAVEHRCLGVSYFCPPLHTCDYRSVSAVFLSGGSHASLPRWPPYCRVETA